MPSLPCVLFGGQPAPRPRFAMGLFPPPTEAEREEQFVRSLRDAMERAHDDEYTLNEARALLESIRAMGRRCNPRPLDLDSFAGRN